MHITGPDATVFSRGWEGNSVIHCTQYCIDSQTGSDTPAMSISSLPFLQKLPHISWWFCLLVKKTLVYRMQSPVKPGIEKCWGNRNDKNCHEMPLSSTWINWYNLETRKKKLINILKMHLIFYQIFKVHFVLNLWYNFRERLWKWISKSTLSYGVICSRVDSGPRNF